MTKDLTNTSVSSVCPVFSCFFLSFSLLVTDHPEFLLLVLLEQGEQILEDHIKLFVEIPNLTHYSDNRLCSFYHSSLNFESRAQLSIDGPRETFAPILDWVLLSCGSLLTLDITDDDTSPTPDPEPSLTSPRCREHLPELIAEGEPKPAATDEPSPIRIDRAEIALEPEPHTTFFLCCPHTPNIDSHQRESSS